MAHVILDFEPQLEGVSSRELASEDLVYFLSWAFSARYGANHEMSLASLVLRGEFGVDLSPLFLFADRHVEDASDEEDLERAWQDARPVSETCAAVLTALTSDDKRLQALQEEYPALGEGLAELAAIAEASAAAGCRLRLTYLL